ncbi:MAG: SDR family oxidoreductase [Actinomycetota bacterium]|nr:SDR family oxidoreductase [Actinomycetota bacterium]MDA3013377.1 SDR family oxidoreductase [Actinomycetota bacterium]
MKTVLITGGSRGIGLATALRFSKEGWNVYITSRKEENLQAVLKDHPNLKGFVAKADDIVAASTTCQSIIEEIGSLDVLINNAGTNPSAGSILEVELSAIQKTWDVNLMGPLMWSREAVKAGLKDSILNVCSVGGIKPSHFMGAYNVSKAGLIYMTKQLAMELAPEIRVNGIAPAVVKTKLSEMLWADEETSSNLHALKRLGEPEDISNLIYFLSSEEASWITGEVVTIDGGFLL